MKEIKLSRGMVALVDDEHYDYLNQWKWCAIKQSGQFYARRSIHWCDNGVQKARTRLMHREIMGVNGMMIDHINRNGLDNRTENLRLADSTQNQMNKRGWSKSGMKGVYRGSKNRFWAEININRHVIRLGSFKSPEDAGRAYDKAAVQIFGDRALLNFPKETLAL